ncbi:hypothetical protein N8T08_011214 [Aspergillus melleus]|uniref:Uncharacterized protein n=1 Tax=Aspergillus melleus TaxID=138277 RepID=A0ACC3AQ47_9EURO|nr:hypothetical protein N8T08_011214 [Aspergillus melleus]
MHNQLQTQPLSPWSQVPPSRGSARPKERNPRHVDLLDALFSSHRYQIQSTTSLSPITPYNEDIAERNMTRFLQEQPRKKNIQNPSIAEVMNSPLPAGTPTSISPLPQSKRIEEIMDMFRKAHSASQAVTPHPTFETLQDAIIREINSHEAFQRVPPPEQGPPFTPSPSQETFKQGHNRTRSLKNGQFSKLARRGSVQKHARSKSSETRKSISTSVPPKVFRRRHTDALPPSPGLFETSETGKESCQEQVTYMDLLLRSEKHSPNPGSKSTISPPPILGRSKTAPSVLHLRAQTSVSSSEGRPSFSADDSDEEVIQLPSVGIPCVQIQGVDENNVSYVTGPTTPRTAYRLMNWPRKSINPRTRSGGNRLQGMRSVESY